MLNPQEFDILSIKIDVRYKKGPVPYVFFIYGTGPFLYPTSILLIKRQAPVLSLRLSGMVVVRDFSAVRRLCSTYSKSKKAVGPQGLVTIQVNILSMYKHIQGRTSFLPPLASSRVCFLNSF